MFLPAVGIEGNVGQKVDGRLEHIEGLVGPAFVEAMLACAALNVHAEHPSLAVGTADVRVLGLTAVIQPHENTVVMPVLVEQLFMYEGGNNLAVNVALTHEVSIHTSHGSVRFRQSEGLRSLLCGLCLLKRFVIFPAQQKQNRLLIREAVIALDEADGVAADARGVIKPFVAPHGDAGIIGSAELPARAHRSLALGAQQRHEIRVLRTCFFLRREIDKLAHDVSFQVIALSVDNMCFITYNELRRKRGECMDYTVEYYEKDDGSRPAEEFILSQDNKMQAKIFAALELLESKGPALREPYSKVLDDGIFEVRAKQGTDISRVLYFFVVGRRVILTNGFVKKTMKTPPREIERAKRYRADFNQKKEA